jgi:hypothetical protein
MSSITISGVVRDYDGVPIHVIKVSVYRDTVFVEKTFTDESGRYMVTIPSGDPVTIWFDTHPTLNEADRWHPSVVSSLSAQKSLVLDRHLVKVGETGGESADVDALAAYQFAAMFIQRDRGSIDDLYPALAARRMSQLKVPTQVLQRAHSDVMEFFRSRPEDHT